VKNQGSVLEPKLFFSEYDPVLALVSDPDPDSNPTCFKELY
jgi:hypothetical protein